MQFNFCIIDFNYELNSYMNLNIELQQRECENCGSKIHNYSSTCEACNQANKTPNVFACSSSENIEVLKEKFRIVVKEADNDSKLDLIELVDSELTNHSGVVVSMPPHVLRGLVSNTSAIYANYEMLVEGGLRTPAFPGHDSKRGVVGSTIFGSYAKEIKYGALSVDNKGVATYGSAFCKLKLVSVKSRTTFMQANSYKIFDEELINGKIPLGCTSDWNNKEYLVLNKLYKYIKVHQSVTDVLECLIQSDGIDRDNDDFIEAHIYGGFTKDSIESLELYENADRQDKIDFEIAINSLKG